MIRHNDLGGASRASGGSPSGCGGRWQSLASPFTLLEYRLLLTARTATARCGPACLPRRTPVRSGGSGMVPGRPTTCRELRAFDVASRPGLAKLIRPMRSVCDVCGRADARHNRVFSRPHEGHRGDAYRATDRSAAFSLGEAVRRRPWMARAIARMAATAPCLAHRDARSSPVPQPIGGTPRRVGALRGGAPRSGRAGGWARSGRRRPTGLRAPFLAIRPDPGLKARRRGPCGPLRAVLLRPRPRAATPPA